MYYNGTKGGNQMKLLAVGLAGVAGFAIGGFIGATVQTLVLGTNPQMLVPVQDSLIKNAEKRRLRGEQAEFRIDSTGLHYRNN
jgi:hypothetical protein